MATKFGLNYVSLIKNQLQKEKIKFSKVLSTQNDQLSHYLSKKDANKVIFIKKVEE